ncbi:MAG TPA: hypothetical protein VD735_04990 [Candidatus Saccharimonadales bacterium]|nr:hypothetical protein [Candidatus Saccharimonadales bacterium]
MLSKLLAVVLCGVVLLAVPRQATAHVLIRDTRGATGAMLHINPDDDPVAGRQTTLYFDIQDQAVAAQDTQVDLVITDPAQLSQQVATKLRGTSIAATYTFDTRGLYQLQLTIWQQGKVLHRFEQSQRVTRGVTGATTVTPPAWAEPGLLVSGVALVLTGIIAYNRRSSIIKYSKMER